MRGNVLQNQSAFPAAQVKHTALASTAASSTSAQHSTRAAAAAPALSSHDPTSHVP
jgi:hypothetical protein